MKRFWLVLLSLGLVLAFSASAMAVDVKFSGSFYAAGIYQDKTSLVDEAGRSTAFYYQRLRVNTEFVVSPGLSLVTRFDAMERVWGAARTAAAGYSTTTSSTTPGATDMLSSGTVAENENIAFDLAYISYTSPIGMFRVGYQDDGAWGTVFGDTTMPLAKIQYIAQVGAVTGIAYIGKFQENSFTAKNASTYTDADVDMYVLAGVYSFKQGSVGLLGKYIRVAAPRMASYNPYTGGPGVQDLFILLPYAKAQIGPVKIQAELLYGFGDYYDFEGAGTDSDLDNLAGWVDVEADFGMVYVGVTGAYVAGDDPTTTDKKEGGVITGGADWNPALIMFNFDRYYWAGQLPGNGNTATPNNANWTLAPNNAGMTNAWFGQARVGVRPTPALDIVASVSYASAAEKYAAAATYGLYPAFDAGNTAVNDRDYGWEVDVVGTYKITNNLSYMLGAGYLFTGDYFKGGSATAEVQDNFLVINKLTLTF